MSKILQQNEFGNGKLNCSNDSLDNQSMILEFALFDRKIGTELNHYHVSFSLSLEHWIFTPQPIKTASKTVQCISFRLDIFGIF